MNQRGQALTEYIVLIAIWLFLVTAPVVDGKSMLVRFIEVFEIYLNSFHTVIALPFP